MPEYIWERYQKCTCTKKTHHRTSYLNVSGIDRRIQTNAPVRAYSLGEQIEVRYRERVREKEQFNIVVAVVMIEVLRRSTVFHIITIAIYPALLAASAQAKRIVFWSLEMYNRFKQNFC